MLVVRFVLRLVLIIALARAAGAGSAHLVADLAPESIPGSVAPSAPVVTIGDDAYFEAVDSTYFGQIWRTNGSPGDLKRLTTVEGGGIRSLAGFAGSLYFVAFETPGVSLRRISPPSEDAEVVVRFRDTETLTPIDAALVFAADDGVHGWEPWRSDGTPAGTFLLADLVAGGAASNPFGFTTADGTFAFFFAATDAGHTALWRTDGTPDGTRRIAGFGTPPKEGFRPAVLGVVAGKLVFTTWAGNARFRLWCSDGTAPGTVPIAEFASDFAAIPVPFPFIGPASNGTTAGGFLYFTANDGVHGDEPWRSDGTSNGTTLVADISPGETGSDPGGFAALGDTVVFSATDAVHGSEPWTASASTPGAKIVRDIHPGNTAGFAYGFVTAGNAVYFTGSDGVSGAEPWRTDGTEDGTFRVADIAPGFDGSRTGFLFAKNGQAYFLADSGGGDELWRTDGSESGTIVVEDLALPASSYPAPAADASGRLYFSTVTERNGDTAYRSLWATTGFSETTTHVRDFARFGPSGFAPPSFLSLGGALFFAADDGLHGDEPWRSNGTPDGTAMIADLVRPTGDSGFPADANPYAFTPFRGHVAFLAGANPSALPQLWETDGTTAGTHLIADLSPDFAFVASPLLAFGSKLFFGVGDSTASSFGLWRSDGTAAGTVLLKSIGADGIYRMVVAGNDFYFTSGNTLWRSDGSPAGTQPVFTSDESIDPYRLETANGLVFFLAGNSSTLWRTDGTESGTFPLIGSATEPTAAGSFVFFAHDDGAHGSELWRTDGTVDRTVLVRDIRPGSIGSFPGDLAAVGDAVWFSANDGVHGIEPWRSDGTEAGTGLVADVLPGIGSSRPRGFMASGEWVYFAADDGAHGFELWAAPVRPANRGAIVAPVSPSAPAVARPPGL